MYLLFIVIFVVSILFIYLVKKNASKLGLLDVPNNRSVHTKTVARGAGIGFYLAVTLVVPIFHFDLLYDFLWSIIAILFVFLIGVLDDHHDTSPNTKFFVLIIATVLLSFDDILIHDIGTFFGIPISLGWFALPFTIFVTVGFTNALNLIDGLDGLAATISVIILSTFFFIGYEYEDLFIMVMAGSFIATLVAFLIFNWQPASIFMGDSGSLTLGFVISLLAIKSLAYIPPISILFVAAVPILDTVIVMIRRKRHGRSMFSADRCHIHHILRHFFAEDTPRTVITLGIMQASYSLMGLQLQKGMNSGYLFFIFVLNIVLLYLFLGAMIKRQRRKC